MPVLAIVVFGFADPAAAQVRPPAQKRPQQPTERIFVAVDGTYQAGTKD